MGKLVSIGMTYSYHYGKYNRAGIWATKHMGSNLEISSLRQTWTKSESSEV